MHRLAGLPEAVAQKDVACDGQAPEGFTEGVEGLAAAQRGGSTDDVLTAGLDVGDDDVGLPADPGDMVVTAAPAATRVGADHVPTWTQPLVAHFMTWVEAWPVRLWRLMTCLSPTTCSRPMNSPMPPAEFFSRAWRASRRRLPVGVFSPAEVSASDRFLRASARACAASAPEWFLLTQDIPEFTVALTSSLPLATKSVREPLPVPDIAFSVSRLNISEASLAEIPPAPERPSRSLPLVSAPITPVS